VLFDFMSRFGNLELGNEFDGQSRGRRPALKDEGHYLAEAHSAFAAGRFEQALRYFGKVLEFNPINVLAWSGQVRMLIELGEFKEARLWADKALEKFPQDPELLAAKAVALGRLGNVEEALALSDAAIEVKGGETPYVWLARGDVLLAREEMRAQFCMDKGLSLAPGDSFILWLAARIRAYYEQFALALKLLQQALEINTGNFVLWLEAGRCQAALGMSGAAEKSFLQALQLNPDCITRSEAACLSRNRVSGWWRRLFQS
jgi:tetratricopeptide (TPR) repeat protein